MPEPALRLARLDEADAIDALMKASTRDLFPNYYDATQTSSAIAFIAAVDRALIADGTYYVAEVNEELVACGGWSRRDKLFTGSGGAAGDARLLDPRREPARIRAMFVRADWTRRGLGRRILVACEDAARGEGFQMLALMATLPGRPLYEAYGFISTGDAVVNLPDGQMIHCVAMEKPISPR
jgi:GNAT superfamily N-acetyltransferase